MAHGCDLNAAGSFLAFGLPIPGKTMEFHVTNPLGTQTAGSVLPLLALSFSGTGPSCGPPVPGWNLDPSQPSGEALVLVSPALPLLTGGLWHGVPTVFPYDIPPLPQLLGLEAFVQGVLVDFSPGAQVPIGLTRGRKLVFGI